MVIGAHPDDCEFKVGGLAALFRHAGHAVRFVSVTNGESGHQTDYGTRLAEIRRLEAAASAAVTGLEYVVLPNRDAYLMPHTAIRDDLIRLIRQFQPDLVVTHRPNDYHPDHRSTSQLVCDAAYLLTVPAVADDVPALPRDPVILYMEDGFQRPYPFSPAIAVDVGPVFEQVLAMLACHVSQFFDWLPYNRGESGTVPADPKLRLEWLRRWYGEQIRPVAERYRGLLAARYGRMRAERIEFCEAYEPCEYGAVPTQETIEFLFEGF